MKAFLAILFTGLMVLASPVSAQHREYTQAELDALLAPVALYPDALLSKVLMAATYPADVGEAAAFLRANPHLSGEQAVHAAQHQPWDPSVKSLLAFPDVLQRMDESPQWMMDLGQAFLTHEPHVMDTVQGLRRRAHAAGHLRNDSHHAIQQNGSALAVVPVQPRIVYVPYYNPYVVYGPWWWPHYRPVHWRPWRPAPVVVSSGFFFSNVDWHHRHVRVIHRPAYVHHGHVHVAPGKWRHHHRAEVRPHHRVPEAQCRPIVSSMPPAAHVHTPRAHAHKEHRREGRHRHHEHRR